MRIHSLNTLPPVEHPVAVIVNSESFGVDLSSFESRSVFFRTVPESPPEALPLVVVNPTPLMVQDLRKRGAFQGQRSIQLWADSTGIFDLAVCLTEFEDLAASGAFSDSNWFKVRVQRSAAMDRSGQDLIIGMKASSLFVSTKAGSPVPESFNTAPASGSRKSGIVQIATWLAKPIKPHLPAPMVHMLYKILGVLQ